MYGLPEWATLVIGLGALTGGAYSIYRYAIRPIVRFVIRMAKVLDRVDAATHAWEDDRAEILRRLDELEDKG